MSLTKTQQRIADFLADNRGSFLTSKEIGRALDLGPSVRTHIYNLRQKGVGVMKQQGGNGYMAK